MDGRGLAAPLDICVLGGSIAGLSFARLVQARRPDCALAVLDAGSSAVAGKAIVIDRAAANCLQRLQALPSASIPINTVRVSLAGIINKSIGRNGAPLGYAIVPQQVQAALRESLPMVNADVARIENGADAVLVTTAAGEQMRTRLLVVACPFALPPPFRTFRLPYHQSIFSLQAETALPAQTAMQKFLPRRVLVLVPRAEDGETGVIICAPTRVAGALNALSDEGLSDYLSRQFDLSVRVHGRRFIYPPGLSRTSPLAHGRVALLGSGATSLHPIGAQAISLAMADAEQLAASYALPPQPSGAALAGYRCRRSWAHRQKALLTSTLALAAF